MITHSKAKDVPWAVCGEREHSLSMPPMTRVLQDMVALGVKVDRERLEEARKLWAMEKVLLGR